RIESRQRRQKRFRIDRCQRANSGASYGGGGIGHQVDDEVERFRVVQRRQRVCRFEAQRRIGRGFGHDFLEQRSGGKVTQSGERANGFDNNRWIALSFVDDVAQRGRRVLRLQ